HTHARLEALRGLVGKARKRRSQRAMAAEVRRADLTFRQMALDLEGPHEVELPVEVRFEQRRARIGAAHAGPPWMRWCSSPRSLPRARARRDMTVPMGSW